MGDVADHEPHILNIGFRVWECACPSPYPLNLNPKPGTLLETRHSFKTMHKTVEPLRNPITPLYIIYKHDALLEGSWMARRLSGESATKAANAALATESRDRRTSASSKLKPKASAAIDLRGAIGWSCSRKPLYFKPRIWITRKALYAGL